MKKLLLLLAGVILCGNCCLAQTTCRCDSNGWKTFEIKTTSNAYKGIKCGGVVPIACNDSILSLRNLYKCIGGANCNAQYSAVLTAPNGTTTTIPSFHFPWAGHFTLNGLYTLLITPHCGRYKNCTPCRISFKVGGCKTVCDCNRSGWQYFTVRGTNQLGRPVSITAKCGGVIGKDNDIYIKPHTKIKLTAMPAYICAGDCKVKFIATLQSPGSTTLQNVPSFAFPWIHIFPAPGQYTLNITPICGDKKCPKCVLTFWVKQ